MVQVGRIDGDVLVESVLRVVDGVSEHWYRLIGGPDDGREFASLAEVSDYLRQRTLDVR